MTTKEPYSWLRYIEKSLVDLDEIPLFGYTRELDWQALTQKLQELLQLSDLEVKMHQWHWLQPDQLEENLGHDSLCLNVGVLPIQGHVSVLMSPADVNSFVSWVVQHKAGSNTLISSSFSEGLLNFVAMEVMHEIQQHPFFDGFLLRLLSDTESPSTRALSADISFKAYGEELTLRLLIPENFRRQWLTHFNQKKSSIPEALASSLNLECSLEVAHLQLTPQDWSEVRVGDYLPLENTTLDLENNSGSLYLSVGQKPLFRVRIKNNGVKILEQPIYQEDSQAMDQEPDDLLSEISDLEKEANKALDPIPEDQEVEEEALMQEEQPEAVSVESVKNPLEKVEMVPLNVVVEISRFKMSCEKLMHLKPGNLIELNVSLEKPVDLVLNGKKIATGELVRIGESLGVQVTDIG